MSNVSQTVDSISDTASIQRTAANAVDRRLALDACLVLWAGKDIGQLERIDTEGWNGWKMWLWQPDA